MSIELIRYNAACRAIAEACTLDELKNTIDKFEAIKEYAHRARNRELEVKAGDLRYRAERKFGELLVEMKEEGRLAEGRPKKLSLPNDSFRVTLDQIETSRNFSSKCQRLANLSLDKFERMLAEWRQKTLDHPDGFLTAKEKKDRRDRRERELGARICALPKKKYGLIYADPEWRFEVWSRETGLDRSADNHYPTSVLDDIKARDVQSLAADDCALALWATVPMLAAAIRVMEDAWGFRYKTHWVWAKDRIGPGYWNRNKHEIFLFGTRGDVPCPAPGDQWDSLLEAARRGHSEKPEIFLEMMESYFPHLPKIELNRRGPARPGWDAWGNEAEPARANQRYERQGISAVS